MPSDLQILSEASDALVRPIDIETLRQTLKNSPIQSGPGLDGLPFAFWRVALDHPFVANLAVKVFNDALNGIFPVLGHTRFSL